VEISTRKYSTVAGKNLRSKTRSICNHVPSTFCIIQYEYIAMPCLFCTTLALVAHICFLGSESCPIAMQKKMCHFLHMSNQCTGTSLHACTVSDAVRVPPFPDLSCVRDVKVVEWTQLNV